MTSDVLLALLRSIFHVLSALELHVPHTGCPTVSVHDEMDAVNPLVDVAVLEVIEELLSRNAERKALEPDDVAGHAHGAGRLGRDRWMLDGDRICVERRYQRFTVRKKTRGWFGVDFGWRATYL